MKKNDTSVQAIIIDKVEKPPEVVINEKYYSKGIGFLALLILAYCIIAFAYLSLHGINVFALFNQTQTISKFDFIGGNSNPLSIGIEAEAWSLMGVICQMAYLSGMALLKGKFEFLKYFTWWISSSLYAWGIAVAVIFSLNIISLNIAGIDITLKNAPIEIIIAISFILGFYSDDARKILGRLRERLVMAEKTESKESDEVSL